MRVLPLALLTAAAGCAAGRLPVAFELNQGQAGPDVQYLARAGGYTLSLSGTRTEMWFRGAGVITSLIGAHDVPGEAEGRLPGVVNYMVGRERSAWHTGVPTFARVRYRDVYPGIDAVYYSHEGAIEYDLVVAPGAQPRLIRIRYQGARGLRVDSAGDLVIDTAAGTMRQRRPTVYQEVAGLRQKIDGRYELRGDTVTFRLGAYDRTRPLVIDPTLTWATYFGSGGADQALGVAIDSAGNVYATGSTQTSRGDLDCFVTKLAPGGTSVVYTGIFGGTLGDDEGKALAVDSTGAVYVVGATDSDDFPIVASAQTLAGLGLDGFFAKIDPTGKNFVFTNYMGGSSDDIVFAVALDSSNNMWLSGATISVDFPMSRTGLQRTYMGGVDGVLSEIDGAGKLLYSSYVGGTGDDYVFGVALDGAGNIYTAGSTTSKDLPGTASGFQTTNGGGTDAWVARFSPGATALQWATYLGGSGDDDATALAIDTAGAAYITGDTTSTNFPTVNPYQASYAGGARDMIAAKISADGTKLVYSTYLGGSGDEIGNAIAVDATGSAYIAGASNSTNFPNSFGFQSASRGASEGTITGLSPAGNTLQFSSFIGGTSDDQAEAVAVSCTAGLAIAGSSASANFPVTSGVPQGRNNGGSDGFVALIAAGTSTTTISPGGVVNAATSASAPVSPGSLVSIYGSNLAATTTNATATPIATTLGGASVSINGVAAPVIFVSPGQINVQVPYEINTGTANATVTAGCGASAPVSFPVVRAAPYLLLAADGSALVQNQDFTFNSATNAAPKASIVTVYLIGIGPLDNPVATGAAAPLDKFAQATSSSKALIGGFDTSIKFLGLTPGFVGLAQANLEVPNLSPGRYPIVITIDGVASNAGTMYVK